MCLGIKYINNKCAHVSEPLSSKLHCTMGHPCFRFGHKKMIGLVNFKQQGPSASLDSG